MARWQTMEKRATRKALREENRHPNRKYSGNDLYNFLRQHPLVSEVITHGPAPEQGRHEPHVEIRFHQGEDLKSAIQSSSHSPEKIRKIHQGVDGLIESLFRQFKMGSIGHGRLEDDIFERKKEDGIVVYPHSRTNGGPIPEYLTGVTQAFRKARSPELQQEQDLSPVEKLQRIQREKKRVTAGYTSADAKKKAQKTPITSNGEFRGHTAGGLVDTYLRNDLNRGQAIAHLEQLARALRKNGIKNSKNRWEAKQVFKLPK